MSALHTETLVDFSLILPPVAEVIKSYTMPRK